MHIISDKVRQLMNFEGDIEPGFSVGAGLRIVLDSSGTGYMLTRWDGTIVLAWPGQTGMIRVTTADLKQPEKVAITRVVRGIRQYRTPNWPLWHAMRKRSKGAFTLLPTADFV